MTWPLLLTEAFEVGYRSTVSVRGSTRLTNVAMLRAELVTERLGQ